MTSMLSFASKLSKTLRAPALLTSASILLFLLIKILPQIPIQAAPPPSFETTPIINHTLSEATGFDFAPDGRVFILERQGTVKIYRDDQLLAQNFINLPTSATGDRGLLGIAFDPNFNQNHFVYFYYTDIDLTNKLIRVVADTDIATTQPELIYQTPQSSLEFHIGGTIAFGPDGKLYLSIGDNGFPPNATDLTSPYGKILRLNPDGTVPSDNPLVNNQSALPEIFAYGFRNPFRFSIHPTTGHLYVGDVGVDTWEEINKITPGGNYGWPFCEGACSTSDLIDPFYQYNHNDSGGSVTLGPVYTASLFPPSYQGGLFFGDFVKGFIKFIELNQQGDFVSVSDFESSAGTIVDAKVAPDGSLYYLTIFPSHLYRINYTSGNQTPIALSSADVLNGQPPLTVNFTGSNSSDPDNDPLTFLWDFGDATQSTDTNPQKSYTDQGRYTVSLTVSDAILSAQANPLFIQVGTPPNLTINSPVDGSTYSAGDQIAYSASATDSQGNPIPANQLSTQVVFHHDEHTHPFLGPLIGDSGVFTIPTGGESSANTWYALTYTATDSVGLKSSQTITISPLTSQITLATNPSGLDTLLDGTPHTSPHQFTTVQGLHRQLSIPVLQQLAGTYYTFNHWANLNPPQHQLIIPSVDTTYTAHFNPLPAFSVNYFNNPDLSGTPVLTTTDPLPNHDWGISSPDPLVPSDNFSARWTNDVFFPSGNYLFITTSDDGVRLFIDGQLVIDQWHPQSATAHHALINLTQGTHNIVMEYYEEFGDAVASLTWQLAADQTPPQPEAFTSQFWNLTPGDFTIPATPPDLTRQDDTINFDWGSLSPDPAVNPDNFAARFTKTLNLPHGDYRFTITADDGFRLYLDDQLALDTWVDQPPTTYFYDTHLHEGDHQLKLEYYENGGGAVISLDISPLQGEPVNFGLLATYFNNLDLTNQALERTDPNINFDWGTDSPDPLINPDTFSVRWQGQVTPAFSETYNFHTTSDDGVRLWVNDQPIIDNWLDQSPTQISGQIDLTAGQPYNLVMEYYENGWGAVASLAWSSPSQPFQAIPQTALTATSVNPPPPPPVDTFQSEFWNLGIGESRIPSTPADLIRQDGQINFNWGSGSPDPLINAEFFAARFTKDIDFEAGNYQFQVTADDGFRLYLNDQILLDHWIDQPPTSYSTIQSITQGTHTLKLEYYEKTGGSVIELNISPQ